MHDGAIRARTRDCRKAQIAKMLALAADRLEPVAGGDLDEPAFRRLMREPGQKAGQCHAVAPVRRPSAVELDRILAGLGQQARISSAVDLGLRRFEASKDPTRRGSWIDLDAAAFGGERIELRTELLRRHDGHPVAEMALEAGNELPLVNEKSDAAVQ